MGDKTLDMTRGKPLGHILRFALPLAVGSAFQLLYNLADSVVVGRLIGLNAFAAVGAAGTLYWLVVTVALGLTQGFGTFLAQRFGARDEDGLRRAFANALLLCGAVALALALGCGVFTVPMLRGLNTPASILPDTAAYLRVLFLGLPATFAYNILGSAFRAVGDSKTPLLALILASLANVALDVLLVLVTPLGVAAVAVATVLAQALAVGYCLLRLSRVPALWPARAHFRPRAATMRGLLRLGGPAGLRNLVITLGNVVIQYYINGWGTAVIAGIAAAKRIYSLLEVAGGALDGAMATYVAQNYGGGRLDRVRAGMRTATALMLGSSTAIAIGVFFAGRGILGLLLGPGAGPALEAALGQLSLMLLMLPALYLLFLYRSALQGLGNASLPMAGGFLEAGLRVAVVALLPQLWGQWGLYAAEVAGWPAAAVLFGVGYFAVFRARRRAQAGRQPQNASGGAEPM